MDFTSESPPFHELFDENTTDVDTFVKQQWKKLQKKKST